MMTRIERLTSMAVLALVAVAGLFVASFFGFDVLALLR